MRFASNIGALGAHACLSHCTAMTRKPSTPVRCSCYFPLKTQAQPHEQPLLMLLRRDCHHLTVAHCGANYRHLWAHFGHTAFPHWLKSRLTIRASCMNLLIDVQTLLVSSYIRVLSMQFFLLTASNVDPSLNGNESMAIHKKLGGLNDEKVSHPNRLPRHMPVCWDHNCRRKPARHMRCVSAGMVRSSNMRRMLYGGNRGVRQIGFRSIGLRITIDILEMLLDSRRSRYLDSGRPGPGVRCLLTDFYALFYFNYLGVSR